MPQRGRGDSKTEAAVVDKLSITGGGGFSNCFPLFSTSRAAHDSLPPPEREGKRHTSLLCIPLALPGETTFSFSLAHGRVLLPLDLEMGSSLIIIISLSICVVRPPLMMLPAGHASAVLNGEWLSFRVFSKRQTCTSE